MPKAKNSAGASGKTPAAELERQIKKFGLSQAQVAKDLGMAPMTLKKLLTGEAKVDIPRAWLFSKYFGTTVDFWIDLQKKAGLADAKSDNKLQKVLKDLKKAKPAAPGAAVGAKRGPKPVAAAKGGAKKKSPSKGAAKKPRGSSGGSSAPSPFSL